MSRYVWYGLVLLGSKKKVFFDVTHRGGVLFKHFMIYCPTKERKTSWAPRTSQLTCRKDWANKVICRGLFLPMKSVGVAAHLQSPDKKTFRFGFSDRKIKAYRKSEVRGRHLFPHSLIITSHHGDTSPFFLNLVLECLLIILWDTSALVYSRYSSIVYRLQVYFLILFLEV